MTYEILSQGNSMHRQIMETGNDIRALEAWIEELKKDKAFNEYLAVFSACKLKQKELEEKKKREKEKKKEEEKEKEGNEEKKRLRRE